MTCEYTYIKRPDDWGVYASGKGMDVEFSGQVTGQDDKSRLTITMKLLPRGLLQLLKPFIKGSFQRNEVKNLANIKAHMEGSVEAHS